VRVPLRLLTLLSALLALPPLVAAQDAPAAAPAASPVGEMLLSAAGERGDRLIHIPSLPAFLEQARRQGFGPAGVWRQALREQFSRWGRGESAKRLGRGAAQLLELADGEVLFLSMRTPPVPGAGDRGTLLALRTSAGEAVLKRALEDLVEGGLGTFYNPERATDEVAGRSVLTLTSTDRTLYLAAQDGLVVAADHPLPLGLLFRGLARAESGGDIGNKLMTTRRGVGGNAWTGWMFGHRESLSGPLLSAAITAPVPVDFPPAVAVAVPSPGDMPFLPVPPPDWVAETTSTGPVSVIVGVRGTWGVAGANDIPRPAAAAERPTIQGPGFWLHTPSAAAPPLLDGGGPVTVGAAAPLGWLRAIVRGNFPLPIGVLDRSLFDAPLAAAEKTLTDGSALPWEARETAGELRGPAFHGPATFLALRLLYDTLGETDRVDTSGGVPLPPPRALPPLPPPPVPRIDDER